MKRFGLVITILSLFLNAKAQSDPGNRKIFDQATGNLVYIYQMVDVQGSQFIVDQWVTGKLFLDNGAYIDNVSLKYDVYNSKLVVNRNDTSYELSPAVKEVRLYISPDTSMAIVLRKGYPISDKVNSKVYVQVLAEGKIGFFKFLKKELEEYSEFGSATKHKRFNDLSQYYVLVNGQYKTTTLSKKNLQDLLTDKWPQVSDYLSKNQLNGKDEKSWQLAIRYYNTL